MVQSLELTLDPASDAALRDQWAALESADLPNAGRHPGASNRPHLTLVAAQRPIERTDALRGLGSRLPLEVRAGGLVLFPSPRGRGVVLSRAIVVTRALLALHAEVHGIVGGDPAPTSRPGEWTPHLTLARRIDADRLAEAIDLLPPLEHPLVIDALRHWDSGTKTVTTLVGPGSGPDAGPGAEPEAAG